MLRIGVMLVFGGCFRELSEVDGIFYDGDGRKVHCAANLDESARNSTASIDRALDRAAEQGETIELYAHKPGSTVTLERIEHVLSGARDRGLVFTTYRELAAGSDVRPGLALAFDDHHTQAWVALRPLLASYGARVTFFVSRFSALSLDQRAELRLLADDGHDLAAHSVAHLRAPRYVEDHGLSAYLDEEVLPSIEALRAEGHEVTSFAYPFGARTGELDRAILRHVPLVRSVVFSLDQPIQSPCPD